jgi:hypothetical protein
MANIDDSAVVRFEENDVEYFTVKSTGESGMSQRGLSRMSGVPQKSLNRWFSDLSHPGVPKWLEPLQAMDLYLSHDKPIFKRGKEIKPIGAKASFKFISLVARNLKYDRAFETLDAIGEIGLTSFIQAKTGWLPEQYQASKQTRKYLDLIISTQADKTRVKHFDSDWIIEATRITGYHWQGMPMANFIRKSVYDYLGCDVVARLCEVNPYSENKPLKRDNYHYQHFHQEADELLLKRQIATVFDLMKMSRSQYDFWLKMRDRFGEGIQLEFNLALILKNATIS